MHLPLPGLRLAASAGARQQPQQEAASRQAHQSEYSSPKAPRIRVNARQRQVVIQIAQGLVNDRAPCRDTRNFAARHEGQQRLLGMPLDSEIDELSDSE